MKKQDRFNNSDLAVVLGLGITGLGVIRNLGRNGVHIVGIDTDPLAVAAFSKYCTQKMVYKKMALDKNFVRYLKSLGAAIERKHVLIPAEDRYVRFVSEYREQLESHFTFVIPDKDLCESIMNKRLFYELAKKHDAPVPKTYFPNPGNGGIAFIAQQVQYPCIIKPVYSKEWDFASTLKAITASDPNDLVSKYSEISKHNNTEVLVQEIIPGGDDQQYSLCVYCDRKAEPLLSFVARKIRQHPTGFGVGTYVESVKEPEVENIGVDFLRKIRYKGVAEIEFRKDSRDNKYKLIEINARSWTQNTLPTRSGVNIIYASYLDAIGKFDGQNSSYQVGVKWINDFRDIFSSIDYIRKKELSLKRWAKSVKGPKEFALFSYDDPAPFLYFPFYSIPRLLGDAAIRLKGSKLFWPIYWSCFFIKNEGVLFFLKLLFRRIIRYERFFIVERRLEIDIPNSEHNTHDRYIDVKLATGEDIKDLQANTDLYAFENYVNKFSKVKTCFFVYYEKKFAGLCWVYFELDDYKYYKPQPGEVIIGTAYTQKELRGRGIGTKLINDICNYLKDRGHTKAIGIVAISNHPSIRMLEKAGFKNVGKFTYMKILGLKILPRHILR